MALKARLLIFSDMLARKGLCEEAELIKRVAHYVPDEGTELPSFWRRNYDYGEGFYCGNMSEKPSISKWLKKKRRKKKRTKALDIVFLLKRAGGDPELRELYEEEANLRAKFDNLVEEPSLNKEKIVQVQDQLDRVQNDILARTLSTAKPQTSRENQLANQIREVEQELKQAEEENNTVAVQSLKEVLTLLEDDMVEIKKKEEPSAYKDVIEQAERLINPQSLVDYFRLALLKENFEEAAKIYKSMLPGEQDEAREISQQYHRAARINRALYKESKKRVSSFITPVIKTAVIFRNVISPRGEKFVVVFTNHFEREARGQGRDFDRECMEAKFGEMFDGITSIPDVWGSRFGNSFVYYTKKYNNRPERRRWELELHSCTPDRRFQTQNRPNTKYLDVGC